MGYTITVSGNQPAEDSSGSREFEERVHTAAREFVQSLDGVQSARAAFDHIPAASLLSDAEADAGATQATTPAGEQAATEPDEADAGAMQATTPAGEQAATEPATGGVGPTAQGVTNGPTTATQGA